MDTNASADFIMAQLQAACSRVSNFRQHDANNSNINANNNSFSIPDRAQGSQGLITHGLLQASNNGGPASGNGAALMDLMQGDFMDGHHWLNSNNNNQVAPNLQNFNSIQASALLQSSPWTSSNHNPPTSQASALVQSLLAEQNGLLNAVVDLASKRGITNSHPNASQNFFASANGQSMTSGNGQEQILALGSSSQKQVPPFLDGKLSLHTLERQSSMNNSDQNQLSQFDNLWKGNMHGLNPLNNQTNSAHKDNSGNDPHLFISKPETANQNQAQNQQGQQIWPQIVSNQDLQSNELMAKWRNNIGLNETISMIDKQGNCNKETMENLTDASLMMPPTLALDLAPPGGANNLIRRFGLKDDMDDQSPCQQNQQNGHDHVVQRLHWATGNAINISPVNPEQDLMYSFMQDKEQEKRIDVVPVDHGIEKNKFYAENGEGNVRSEFPYIFNDSSRDPKWQLPSHKSMNAHQTSNLLIQDGQRNGYNSSDSDNVDKLGQEEVLHPDLNAEQCAENNIVANSINHHMNASGNLSRKRSLDNDGHAMSWGDGREKQNESPDNNALELNWDEDEEEEMTKDKHQAMVEALLPRRPGPRRKSGPVTAPCAAARERRERIACHIRTLQRLVPSRNKMDSASVLADTIRFVKQLLKQIQDMKAERGDVGDNVKDGIRNSNGLTMGSGSGDIIENKRSKLNSKDSPSHSINANNSNHSPNGSTC